MNHSMNQSINQSSKHLSGVFLVSKTVHLSINYGVSSINQSTNYLINQSIITDQSGT